MAQTIRKKRKKGIKIVGTVVIFIVIAIVFVAYVFPIFWMGVTSLKTKGLPKHIWQRKAVKMSTSVPIRPQDMYFRTQTQSHRLVFCFDSLIYLPVLLILRLQFYCLFHCFQSSCPVTINVRGPAEKEVVGCRLFQRQCCLGKFSCL